LVRPAFFIGIIIAAACARARRRRHRCLLLSLPSRSPEGCRLGKIGAAGCTCSSVARHFRSACFDQYCRSQHPLWQRFIADAYFSALLRGPRTFIVLYTILVSARMRLASKIHQTAMKAMQDKLNNERQRQKQAESAARAVALPIAAAAHGTARPDSNQQKMPIPPASQVQRTHSTAQRLHMQSHSAPASRHSLVTATGSSDTIGSVMKRPRPDSEYPGLDVESKRRSEPEQATPVFVRNVPATPVTYARSTFTLHPHRTEPAATNRSILGTSPHTSHLAPTTTAFIKQLPSPPTPQRPLASFVTATVSPYKTPVQKPSPLQNMPHSDRSSAARPELFGARPASIFQGSTSRTLYTRSPPPPNEPTPPCPCPPNQLAQPFHVEAGFHNDGNTCYLRSSCAAACHAMILFCITRCLSAALVVLLSQTSFVTAVSSRCLTGCTLQLTRCCRSYSTSTRSSLDETNQSVSKTSLALLRFFMPALPLLSQSKCFCSWSHSPLGNASLPTVI